MTIQEIKNRFGIIGNSPLLNRAIEVAMQVAPTDITVLVTGESGSGKETFPKIIHQLSARKHGTYIAVNCGAIPEGTIDSELFGHEKGSFTGAHETRKGYFEVADGGTIFLDEVAEMPLATQARLLRVLETGEFIKVGSSKTQKTNVRVVAATNVNIPQAIERGKFREDLYYRLNTVPIYVPSLRNRREDIHLLFRKFASDFAEKYRMPAIKLEDDAVRLLENYSFPGNVRQLKNIVEQISIIEKERNITAATIQHYLPADNGKPSLPAVYEKPKDNPEFSERELLYKVLFDMKKDINDMKKLVVELISNEEGNQQFREKNAGLINKLYREVEPVSDFDHGVQIQRKNEEDTHFVVPEEVAEQTLSLEETEIGLIKRALEKHKGKRKDAAAELGISERTLYRKINEYNIDK
ncbi:MAG: Anaerobic nitric oxide reductase transcription regulator NorR [Bacteroidia bacterium]|nr:Anaerobic nitric oxide reductase transcription regulator NorR [Bacteroidia bacterium]